MKIDTNPVYRCGLTLLELVHLHIYNPRNTTSGDSNCVGSDQKNNQASSYLSTQLKFQIEFDCSREEHLKHSHRPDSIEGRILRNVCCNLHCVAILCISICSMSPDFEEFLKWGGQEWGGGIYLKGSCHKRKIVQFWTSLLKA